MNLVHNILEFNIKCGAGCEHFSNHFLFDIFKINKYNNQMNE